MYFTDTPALNSVEAIMRKTPHFKERGGSRNRIPYNTQKKDGDFMIYQSDCHRQLFEMEKRKLCKPDKRKLAVLYLLTANNKLWRAVKRYLDNGRVNFRDVRLCELSPDSYVLWKAAKEIQLGERQISLFELSDKESISDSTFRLIVQAAAVARFATAVSSKTEEIR